MYFGVPKVRVPQNDKMHDSVWKFRLNMDDFGGTTMETSMWRPVVTCYSDQWAVKPTSTRPLPLVGGRSLHSSCWVRGPQNPSYWLCEIIFHWEVPSGNCQGTLSSPPLWRIHMNLPLTSSASLSWHRLKTLSNSWYVPSPLSVSGGPKSIHVLIPWPSV